MKVCVTSNARIHLGFYTYPPDQNPWRGAGIYLSKPSITVCMGEYTDLRVPECFDAEQTRRLTWILGGNTGARVYGCIPPHRGLGSSTQLFLSAAMALSLYKTGSFNWEAAVHRLKRYVTSRVGALLFKYGGVVVDGSTITDRLVLKPLYTEKLPDDWRIIIVDPGGPSGPRESWEEENWASLPPAPAGFIYAAYEAIAKMMKAVKERNVNEFTIAARILDDITGEYFSRIIKSSARKCSGAMTYMEKNNVHLMQSSWGPTLYTFAEKGDAWSTASIIREAFELEGCRLSYLDVVLPWNQGARVSWSR